MKRTAICILMFLAIPVLSQGSVSALPHLELPELETGVWDAYHLVLDHEWYAETGEQGGVDLTLDARGRNMADRAMTNIPNGALRPDSTGPRDMISMMSFVWARMFGGVDIVAEAREFARQVRLRGRHGKVRREKERDSRNQWRFVVACRIDSQTEVSALLRSRRGLLGEGSLAFEINTLDPLSEEIGLTMAYSDGYFDIRADRMTLTETAAAKITVKF